MVVILVALNVITLTNLTETSCISEQSMSICHIMTAFIVMQKSIHIRIRILNEDVWYVFFYKHLVIKLCNIPENSRHCYDCSTAKKVINHFMIMH